MQREAGYQVAKAEFPRVFESAGGSIADSIDVSIFALVSVINSQLYMLPTKSRLGHKKYTPVLSYSQGR
uniref:Uncharacterized protein n=1 Tax=Physcomitrium patens TaxID=3218 RepID=A0A2K1IVR6_PHYPA|nr:hypothetical protein PHYPA_025313 [Physcomitrium patens]